MYPPPWACEHPFLMSMLPFLGLSVSSVLMTPATRWWESPWNCNRLSQEIKQCLETRIFSQMADTHTGPYSCPFSTVCFLFVFVRWNEQKASLWQKRGKGMPALFINRISLPWTDEGTCSEVSAAEWTSWFIKGAHHHGKYSEPSRIFYLYAVSKCWKSSVLTGNSEHE